MPPKNNIDKQKPSAVQWSENCYHCEMTQADMRWSGSYMNLFTPGNDTIRQLHIYANSQHLQSRSGKVKMLVLQLYEVLYKTSTNVGLKKILIIIYIFPIWSKSNCHSQQKMQVLYYFNACTMHLYIVFITTT
jgi:hypothetical protein